MNEIETLYSVPGEWIGGEGRPRPRRTPRRILVLKPDHIGDLLIVDQAFALLRHFFPDARIELVCGTWNVALAHGLGRFDAVHGVNLFHEVSGRQSDHAVAAETRRAGAQTLRDLRLGYFDLAIDLRYDADSRPLLRNIEAGCYAGIGSAPEFPFLDIVVPRHHGHATAGAERASILGDGFGPRLAAGVEAPAGAQGNGDLSSRRSAVTLTFDITGAATPRACGTGNDDRLLGIGVEGISVTPLGADDRPVGTPVEARPTFGGGWASPEPWGCWSTAGRAQLSLPVPHAPRAVSYRIEVAMRAHVNAANPRVVCVMRPDGGTGETIVEFDHPMDCTLLGQTIPARLARRELVSTPFDLAPGRYDGMVRILATRPLAAAAHLEFVLRAIEGNVELLRRAVRLKPGARGLINLPFAAMVDTVGGRFTFEVETTDAALLDGVRVHQVDFELVERLRTTTPVAHMSEWASLLVLRTAQLLSEEPPFGRHAPHLRSGLMRPPGGAAAPPRLIEIEATIAGWKAAGDAVIGIALGCNSAIRKWPGPYFIDLTDRILRMDHTRVVFIGGPADAAEAADACALLGLDPAVHSLCGATRLEWLGVLLSRLDLFLGSNTGTTHFAGKVGVRTIGIYAGTNHPREWGPIGEEATWIFRNEPCAPCHLSVLHECTKGHRCMMDLLPDTVFDIVRPEIEAIVSRRGREVAAAFAAAVAEPPALAEPVAEAIAPAPALAVADILADLVAAAEAAPVAGPDGEDGAEPVAGPDGGDDAADDDAPPAHPPVPHEAPVPALAVPAW